MRLKYILFLLSAAVLICLLGGCRGDTDPPADTAPPTEESTPTDTTETPATEADTEPEDIVPEITLPFPVPTNELPVISIDTKGAAVTSRSEYVDMTMTLTGVEDALLDVGGEIRLRGNSTFGYEKKPYRIRLYQKHSLMGLEKAKSWVLLERNAWYSFLSIYAKPIKATHNSFSINERLYGLSKDF